MKTTMVVSGFMNSGLATLMIILLVIGVVARILFHIFARVETLRECTKIEIRMLSWTGALALVYNLMVAASFVKRFL